MGIAQGSSERQISICVEKQDCTKALRAAHAALALSNTQLCVAVIGSTGMVGSELLQQLAESKRVFNDPQALSARRQVLDDLRLDFKVTAVARQGEMRLCYDGLDVGIGEELFDDEERVQPSDPMRSPPSSTRTTTATASSSTAPPRSRSPSTMRGGWRSAST